MARLPDQDLRKPVGATLVAFDLNGRLPTVGTLSEVAPTGSKTACFGGQIGKLRKSC